MVSFKWLFLAASATMSVLGQDAPTGDAAAAAAYWDAAATGTLVAGDPPEKRDEAMVNVVRSDDHVVMKDPYKGSWCPAPYTTPPCATTCNRNNCFRSFLNARGGSSGKHCPKEAFGFCCAWNHAKPFFKWFGIQSGVVYHFAPYVSNCEDKKDSTWDVLKKIDDACGCTLNHEVKVDVKSDYYDLRWTHPYSHKCH